MRRPYLPAHAAPGRRRRPGHVLAAALGAAALVAGTVAFVDVSPVAADNGQTVSSLHDGLTAAQLAASIVGDGITISNVSYVGDAHAAGEFGGFGPSLGIPNGVVLSSGSVVTTGDDDGDYESSVLGPNDTDSVSGEFDGPGDSDLTSLLNGGDPAGTETTHDASVLEFDFVPEGKTVSFQYVFGSDEYNEFIGQFNDVFGFFVDGTNCATVGNPAEPVSVNDINGGYTDSDGTVHPPVNGNLFRDNDPTDFPDGTPIDAQPDGLTTTLTCVASVNPGQVNHLKLAIADADDDALDSDVFIAGGSFSADNPPVANNDSYTTSENNQLTVGAATGLLANDTDADGDPLTVDTTVGTAPSHGRVEVNADGSFTYTPNEGYSGPDSFTYEANDGVTDSNPATVAINVTAAATASPPTAGDDTYSTTESTTLTVPAPGVLGNDSDPAGAALTAVPGTGPAHGSVTLNPNGGFSYVPTEGYSGPDSFTYTATDGTLTSAPATVSITVQPAPIVARDDNYTVPANVTTHIAAPGVLANDDGATSAVELTNPTHGTVSFNEDGSFAYTPDEGFTGTDSFDYTAGGDSQATVTLTVGQNHAPVANDDTYTGNENTTITADTRASGVLGNDTDADGDTLSAILVKGPAHGTLSLQPDGTFSYLPTSNFSGTDTVTYRASDGSAVSNVATVTLHVTPVAGRPVAVPDVYTTAEGIALNVASPGVLGNDTGSGSAVTAVTDTQPQHGTATLAANGRLHYVPNAGFVGDDGFTYHDQAGEARSERVHVTIHVRAVDHAPVAHPDAYTTPENTRLTVVTPGVLANDSDVDGDALSAIRNSLPAHGTLTLNANGRFVYQPASGYTGTDSFSYHARDGELSSSPVRVSISVTRHRSGVTVPPPSRNPPTSPPASTPPATPTPTAPTTPVTVVTPTPVTTAPVAPTSGLVDAPTTPAPTAPTPTSSHGSSSHTTASDGTPSHTTGPSSPAPSRSKPGGSDSRLRLDALSVLPGGALRARGTGCPAGAPVSLTVAGRPAGMGTADGSGGFDIGVTTTGFTVGDYTVTAVCGAKLLAAPVSLVYVTSNTTAPTAQALVVAAALAFFLLLLGLVIRRPSQ